MCKLLRVYIVDRYVSTKNMSVYLACLKEGVDLS